MAKHLFTAVAAAALGAVAITGPALADSVFVTNVSANDGLAYVVLADPNGYVNAGNVALGSVNTTFEPVGEFQATTYNGTSAAGPASTLNAWCLDINESISLGTPLANAPIDYTNDIAFTKYTGSSIAAGIASAPGNSGASVPTMNVGQLNEIEWLANYGFSHLTPITGSYVPTASQNALSAAIQVLIWNIEYGTTLLGVANVDSTGSDLGSNAEYATGSANTFTSPGLYTGTQAEGIYNAISADMSNLSGEYFAQYPSPPTSTSFPTIGLVDPLNGTQALLAYVPEPASMALVAGGIVGLGALRRRRRAR